MPAAMFEATDPVPEKERGIKFPRCISTDSMLRTPPANKQKTTWLAMRLPEAANKRPDGKI
jgi:hypothetical protein